MKRAELVLRSPETISLKIRDSFISYTQFWVTRFNLCVVVAAGTGYHLASVKSGSAPINQMKCNLEIVSRIFLFFIVTWTTSCAADNASTDALGWKLTLGQYFYRNYSGSDANLRWQKKDTHAWVGVYSDTSFGSQFRAGADTSIAISRYLQMQPSLQVATPGFIGGSLNAQIGDEWYCLIGFGRTNLKPYFNLNFDPNDAVTYGAGHRTSSGGIYTIFVVADDRLGTHQRDWHFNARIPVNASRITFDVMHKSGIGDTGLVDAWGFSATYDWPKIFARVAYDPKQNFSAQDAWRVSGGIRF